jgi:hypothetical protein
VTEPLKLESLLGVLVEHKVDFVIVGGFAVVAHGYVRATKEVDICPDPAKDNLDRLAAALTELEAEPLALDDFAPEEFDLRPDREGLQFGGNWTLRTKHGRLDVLQHIKGLGADEGGWKELSRRAVRINFVGYDCLFAGYEELLSMKRAAGRPQDELDIKSLRAARGEL